MDVQMPGMDGLEATRRLRALPGLAELPVVALTAGALPQQREEALAAGMDAFLVKPLEPASLVQTLLQVVQRARRQALANAGATAPVDAVQWPEFPGVDSRGAAQRLGGDLALFARSLGRLLAEFDDLAAVPAAATSISASTASEPQAQLALAARAHKLRGSAGLLGATTLEAAAAQLESRLRLPWAAPAETATDSHEAAQLLQQDRQAVATALQQLRQASAAWLARPLGPGPGQAPGAEPANATDATDAAIPTGPGFAVLLRRLRQQLLDNDLHARHTLDSLEPALQAQWGVDALTLLAAAIDNHVHHGNALGIDVRRISWKRVMDMNDRALRDITVGLGGPGNGYPRQDGFDIVVASEVMAVLCLATSLADLKARLGRIIVAETREREPVTAADLKVHGAMTVLLKDALAPNLVQTLENNPAILHGGPFANIAHGCNSVIATKTALKLADYVVTEAGFGADLGAEKFIDIKCRKAGLHPAAAVVVATVRALKFHGGVELLDLGRENLEALGRGLANIERHLHNLREVFGLPVVVGINHFGSDTEAEHALLRERIGALGVAVHSCRHWAEGGAGAAALAHEVVRLCAQPSTLRFAYDDELPLWDKLRAVATRTYGAADIRAPAAVRRQVQALQDAGHGRLPVCVAKTQYSFSTDPALRGAPSGHVLELREVRLAAGAGFVVMVCGDIMTMPGLPKVPSAERIDLDDDGGVIGLS
jgi:formate--tetrahydrofolate ligase